MDDIKQILKKSGINDYRFEAAQILSLPENMREQAVNRRLAGEPLQYILGEWEFYSLPFKVGPGVLIPRPETELLVDLALEFLKPGENAIDMCSGSGAIAVALSKNAGLRVDALEKYPAALDYLRQNVASNNADVNIIEGDIFSFVPDKKYSLILSNPPYIKTGDMASLQKEVQFEPCEALDGGDDGLVFYRRIAQFTEFLSEHGGIAVECGFNEADDIAEIFSAHGLEINILRDLSGVQRVVFGTLGPCNIDLNVIK